MSRISSLAVLPLPWCFTVSIPHGEPYLAYKRILLSFDTQRSVRPLGSRHQITEDGERDQGAVTCGRLRFEFGREFIHSVTMLTCGTKPLVANG